MSAASVSLRSVRSLAANHGMFVVEKFLGDHTDYILYRKTATRPVRIGLRRDPAAFCRLVEQAAQVKQ